MRIVLENIGPNAIAFHCFISTLTAHIHIQQGYRLRPVFGQGICFYFWGKCFIILQ